MMIKNTILCVFVLLLASMTAYAQHPGPQLRPGPSMQTPLWAPCVHGHPVWILEQLNRCVVG
jgi:hypothetical protein